MKRLCYITRNYKTITHGGGKARVDSEDILASMGAVNLGIKRTFHRNKVLDFFLTFAGIIHFMFAVRRGDVVVLQYPVKKYYRFICRWAHIRGAKTVTLIHDLGSFRRKRLTPVEEIAKLSHTDCIIAANAGTVRWLRDNGCRVTMVEQVAWDFLSESVPDDTDRSVSCAFVGNVSPKTNGFLYHLPKAIPLYLYGGGAEKTVSDNNSVEILGPKSHDELIRSMKGGYGLVWYGAETDSKVASGGEYLAVNNPHKLALYVRAGKPVVIWRGAGAAPFVEKNGIGFAVDSLEDLDRQLKAIRPERYVTMHENVRRVSDLMSKGHYLRAAVTEAVGKLN